MTRAEHRALDRAHAADGDHREGEHDDLDADAERHRDLRGHHGAAERAEHGADDEGHGVDQPDIDAEHRRRLAVEDHHREQPAPARVVERPIGAERDEARDGDEADVVVRQDQVADLDVAGGHHRLIGGVGLRPPDQGDGVLQDEKAGIGDEDDHDLVAAVDEAQDAALQHEADHHADRHGEHDHEQEAAGLRPAAAEIDADRRRRAIGAEGVERAVGHVEDLHHPEDEGEPDRDEKEIGGVDEAVGHNGEGGEHDGPRKGMWQAEVLATLMH